MGDHTSYNCYSYLLNNPLNATDPSGFFFKKLWDEIRPFVGAIVAIALTAWCGPCSGNAWGAAFTGAAAGAAGSAANGGNIFQGMLTGAVSGALFYGIGQSFTGEGFLQEGGWGHIGSHAMAGGLMSVAQGGRFEHGFAAAGFTKAMNINGISEGDTSATAVASRVTLAALVGGTASEITGGKFANGAVTAALAQAVNGEEYQKRVEKESLAERNRKFREKNGRTRNPLKIIAKELPDWWGSNETADLRNGGKLASPYTHSIRVKPR